MSAQRAIGEAKSARTRVRILNAAATTFGKKGYAATTLNELAQAAKLKKGSIYYHFESKEQILEEVMSIGIERVSRAVPAAVAGLPADAPPSAKVRAAVAAHLSSLLAIGDYTSANFRQFGQLPPALRRRNLYKRRKYADYWQKLLEEARDAGEIDRNLDLSLARMFLLGGLNWTIEWFDTRKRPLEDFVEEVCRIFFHGAEPARAQNRMRLPSA